MAVSEMCGTQHVAFAAITRPGQENWGRPSHRADLSVVRPLAVGPLKHATLQALHFPLMKMRGIQFWGQVFSTKELIWLTCLQAWIGFFGKHKGLWKQKQQLQAGAGLASEDVYRASFCWSGCVHTASLYNYYLIAFLEWLHLKQKTSWTQTTQ